ncbi:DUF6457 domain-containing protein [Corynebacterium sp. p3-SID1056]|uniref:DUF6457 domain-containing protein n=1 Tax=Corynebacterium sp. p3-SID1056 TaxID=2916092 RepID=UPI0021A6B24A|nr:DUF6457 domain-containing protein [Corynebacterium sp. p3-SID1056]MCT2339399.1 DUF6457 domain-containing protein [Corynebacterium sp. p3-SID1056]
MAQKESLQSTHDWLAALAEQFGVSPALVRSLVGDILQLTADVAHNGPSRPAAPTTAFLVGLAAGQADLPNDEAEQAEKVRALIAQTSALLQRYGAENEGVDEQD